MKASQQPSRHRETAVRSLMRRAELVRYWWEYRGRLKALLAVADPGNTVRLTPAERRDVRAFWSRYDINHINPDWYRLFKALTGVVDPRFVPEETFRTRLEPLLCRRDVSAAYHDKNQIDRLFADLPRPTTVLRNIYGGYADGDYRAVPRAEVMSRLASRPGPYFLKPAISGTGSGQNVARVEPGSDGLRIGASPLTLDEVERVYVQDFVVQDQVVQHEALGCLHPGSLNTLRVITLRFDGALHLLAVTLRMGNGSHVDNGHAGGLLCGVDLGTGRLGEFACDVQFRRFAAHPLSGLSFAGRVVPSFDGVKRLAMAAHERLPYFDVVSSDLAVRSDGSPCLIEVNTFGQGVEPHQFLQGRPLFGDRTPAVLSLVAGRGRAGWNQ